MGIELYWDNDEQTIMLAEFGRQWSWDEMFSMLDDIKKVTEKRDDEIGAILDVTDGFSIPGGNIFSPETRNQARRMLSMSAEGKGPIVMVGTASPFKMLAGALNMLDKSAMDDVYFADTLDEARALMSRRLKLGRRAMA